MTPHCRGGEGRAAGGRAQHEEAVVQREQALHKAAAAAGAVAQQRVPQRTQRRVVGARLRVRRRPPSRRAHVTGSLRARS